MGKTLFFHINDNFSGSTRVLAEVIAAEYGGQPVTVITKSDAPGPLSALSNVRIVRICDLKFKGKSIPVLSRTLTLLHAFLLALYYGASYKEFYINTITPFYAGLVGALYRKKVIYHVHEKYVERPAEIRFAEYVFNHVRATRIFVSHYVESCYPEKTGCVSIVRYNTLPASFLSKVNVTPVEGRKRDSVLMLCSLSAAKGVFTFIQLAGLLPQLKFRMVVSAGVEKIDAFLEGTVRPENLEIFPLQTDVHRFYRESDLNLNLSIPSQWVETFGMTILEAMAYGIPSIVPNVGGPVEVVTDGFNGYCVDVTDVGGLAAKVVQALEPENYMRLSENALLALTKFV